VTRGRGGASVPVDAPPATSPEGPALAAWSAIAAVYQAVVPKVVADLEDGARIDSGAFSVLAYLARAEPPGRMRLRDLQARMRVRYSQPGLSRLVQRMEADGVVDRRPDPADGRATVLALTAAGRRRLRAADAVYRAALVEHFARHVDPATADRVVAVLGAIPVG
jgi:DNA-binding MarR family transcriptional regulator